MKKILIIYHRIDYDGIFSGCIAKDFYSQDPTNVIKMVGWNWNDPLNRLDKYLKESDTIVITDISLSPEYMSKLKNIHKKEIIWIDHHESSIKNSETYNYNTIKGIRGIDKSAAEYCWIYFFGNTVPKIIQYISAGDIWDKFRFNWEKETYPLKLGLKINYGLLEKNIYENWNDLINDETLLEEIIYDGQLIYEYLEKTWKSSCDNYSFPVKVDGKYNGVCLLNCEFGSNQFKSIIDAYDIYLVVNRKGPNEFNLSMYKEPGRLEEFSCSEYMEKFGGGGHFNSAAAKINLEQFIKLVKDCEI